MVTPHLGHQPRCRAWPCGLRPLTSAGTPALPVVVGVEPKDLTSPWFLPDEYPVIRTPTVPEMVDQAGAFEKWHGNGNDFILIFCTTENLAARTASLQTVAPKLCNRLGAGVGADGIMLMAVRAEPRSR